MQKKMLNPIFLRIKYIAIFFVLLKATAVIAQDAKYFNVQELYESTSPPPADYTAVIDDALDQIRGSGVGGVLYFPPGIYNTKGNHDVSMINGLVIRGSGISATILDITDVRNDLFYWSKDSNITAHTYRDFTVTSSVNREDG